jgi:predicted component of type VI protein secretion system
MSDRKNNSHSQDHSELPYLDVFQTDGQTRRFELFDYRMVVGRTPDADLQIDDPQISRRHAKIKKISKGRWLVRDLGSRNKTFYNNRPITSHVLNNGDELYFGDVKVVFHDPTGHSDPPMDHTVYQDGEEALNRTYAGMAVDFGPEPVPGGKSGLVVRDRPHTVVYNAPGSPMAMDPAMYGDDPMDQNGEPGGTPINMALVRRVLHYKWTIGVTFDPAQVYRGGSDPSPADYSPARL